MSRYSGVQVELGAYSVLSNGMLRFEVVLQFDRGFISIDGFRFDPKTGQVRYPLYRGSKGGWLPLVRLDGPWLTDLYEKVRRLAAGQHRKP